MRAKGWRGEKVLSIMPIIIRLRSRTWIKRIISLSWRPLFEIFLFFHADLFVDDCRSGPTGKVSSAASDSRLRKAFINLWWGHCPKHALAKNWLRHKKIVSLKYETLILFLSIYLEPLLLLLLRYGPLFHLSLRAHSRQWGEKNAFAFPWVRSWCVF